MKHLLVISVGLAGAIAPITPAFAQVGVAVPATHVQQQSGQAQSQLLITDPVSLAQPGEATKSKDSPTSTDRLNQVANSIQVNPSKVNTGASPLSSIPIPRDLFRTPAKLLPDSHPLEVFQTHKPDPSLGINLNGI